MGGRCQRGTVSQVVASVRLSLTFQFDSYVAELRSLVELYVEPLLRPAKDHVLVAGPQSRPATVASRLSTRELPIASHFQRFPSPSSMSLRSQVSSVDPAGTMQPFEKTTLPGERLAPAGNLSNASVNSRKPVASGRKKTRLTSLGIRSKSSLSAATSSTSAGTDGFDPAHLPQHLRDALQAVDLMLRGHEDLCAQL